VVVRCTYVQWFGRTCIHPRNMHYVFMRCRLDLMVLCILTSCATAGMLYHKFNYRLIETTQPYFKSHWIFCYTECSAVKLTVFGISQHILYGSYRFQNRVICTKPPSSVCLHLLYTVNSEVSTQYEGAVSILLCFNRQYHFESSIPHVSNEVKKVYSEVKNALTPSKQKFY
jgi:hypothetical protein